MSKTHLIKSGDAFVALSGDKYTLVAEPKQADLFTPERAEQLASQFGPDYRAELAPPPVYFSILGRMGGIRKTGRKRMALRKTIVFAHKSNAQKHARKLDEKRRYNHGNTTG